MTKKQQIIKEYNKVEVIKKHPSYGVIAKKLKVSKTYVWDVIKEWKRKDI